MYLHYAYDYIYIYMEVSWNGGTTIVIIHFRLGFSIVNHPFGSWAAGRFRWSSGAWYEGLPRPCHDQKMGRSQDLKYIIWENRGESGIVIHESGRIWALSELTSPTLRFLSEMIILVAPSLAVFVDPRPGPRVVAAGHIRPTWASESLDASRHCGIRRWILIIHIYTMDPCSMYIWAEIMRTYSKDSV